MNGGLRCFWKLQNSHRQTSLLVPLKELILSLPTMSLILRVGFAAAGASPRNSGGYGVGQHAVGALEPLGGEFRGQSGGSGLIHHAPPLMSCRIESRF